MQSLGALDNHQSIGTSGVNTHRRVVGSAITANELFQPFLWTPERDMQRLPTLGGGQGAPQHVNELGQIAGFSTTAEGAVRAALWTPTVGSLVAGSEAAAPTGKAR
jgi:uncharacterized membrane protein